MGKIKYRFNPETLNYEKVQFVFSEYLYKKILPHFALAFILGLGIAFLATIYIDSPAERDLITKNNQLKLEYDLLNKKMTQFASELEEMQNRDDNIYRSIFEAKPIPNSIRKAGFGGIDKYASLNGFENSPLMIKTAYNLDVVSKQMVVQSKSYDEVIELVKNKEKMLSCIPAIQPISNKDLTRFGSAFGYRLHPILNYVRPHNGVDLTAPTGTNVYSAGDGVIVQSGWQKGYGNVVKVNHGYGYLTVYAHLSKVNVKPGQKVKRGDVVGLVGSTGLSTSPHLHYEVRINNIPVNPVNFYSNDLTDEEYQQMIETSKSANTHSFEW